MKSTSRKVIVVGSSGVGKTSLISSFIGNAFKDSLYPTVSPSYLLKTITIDEKHEVDLNIWDTAGQEQYQDIGRAFYHGSDVGIVCFDNKESDMLSVPTWIDRIREQVQNCCIFLAATKYDLISQDEDLVSKINSFANETVQKYKLAGFYMTSAKEKIGIEEMFDEIAKIELTNRETVDPVDVNDKEHDKGCKC
ncbi:hypothetical protein M9Y10_008384 [Tritrichomonas musculus]|uniref:Small GTP-binding protein n=1 Tax=Tritrichomonas musculus TaxID=1915356 RepID=A0ABR2IYA9_9EUKA